MRFQKQFKSKANIKHTIQVSARGREVNTSRQADLDNSSEELATLHHQLVDPTFEIELNVDTDTRLILKIKRGDNHKAKIEELCSSHGLALDQSSRAMLERLVGEYVKAI